MLLRHTTIGNEATRAFALKVGDFHQRPDLELTTKVALLFFLHILHNYAIGFPQMMTLIENEDPDLKKFLFKPITDQAVLKDLDILYDELEELTGNRAFR